MEEKKSIIMSIEEAEAFTKQLGKAIKKAQPGDIFDAYKIHEDSIKANRPPLNSVENVIINAQIDALDTLKYIGSSTTIAEEKVTLTEMFEFVKWKEGSGFELHGRGYWYEPARGLPNNLLKYSDTDLWNKFKERNK